MIEKAKKTYYSLKKIRDSRNYVAELDADSYLQANAKFWEKKGAFNNRRDDIIISEFCAGLSYGPLAISAFSATLAAAYGAQVYHLSKEEVIPYHQARQVIQKSFYKLQNGSIKKLSEGIDTLAIAKEIHQNLKSLWDIINIQYKGLSIGEQIYDSVLKYANASVWDVKHKKLLLEIHQAISTIEAIDRLLETKNVKAGFFTHQTGTYMGIASKRMVQRGLPVYQSFGLDAFKRYTRFDNALDHLSSIITMDNALFERVYATHREKLETLSEEYMQNRVNGKVKDWDALKAYSKTSKTFSRKEFCERYNLPSDKPIAFVMLHAMADDPHAHKQFMFLDYYDWFATTLRIARQSPHINWVFKQHPQIAFYPDDANLKGIFSFIDEPNIVYIDETASLSTASVPHIADAVITCNGTAALEFTCFGVSGILGCENPYSGKGLCAEPKSIDEYKALLQNIGHLPKPDAATIKKAKVLFYLVYEILRKGFFTGYMPYMVKEEIIALQDGQVARTVSDIYNSPRINELSTKIDAIIASIRQAEKEKVAENKLYFSYNPTLG